MIPVYAPSLGSQELLNVQECIRSTWISSKGAFIEQFEEAFSGFTGSKHCLTVSNGTVALHLALLGLDIKAGEKVAVPTFTYVASVNAIRYVGAVPIFVDSDPVTLQMCPVDFAAKAAAHELRAVIVVHLYGQACDMDAIMRIAEQRNIKIVEDCAEAFGTRIGNRHVGTFGRVATYSFFGNKTITTGEGGMVVTDDASLALFMRKLRGQGLVREGEYWHDVIGYNYRMTNICASIGLAQINRAEEIIQAKRTLADRYRSGLKGAALTFHDEQRGTTHSYWMCSVMTQTPRGRDALRQHLRSKGVDSRPFFAPVHTMPMYRQWNYGPYPGAADVSPRGVNIPSWPGLSIGQIEQITDALLSFNESDARIT